MRYSEQSRNLAAKVVLEAAVSEAVALLRGGWHDAEPMPGFDIAAYWMPADRGRAEAILLAAGESAELLIGRAS